MKIAHLTSVHPRFDTRIYYKMCKSLNQLGEVYLLCADGKVNENKDNINIIDVGKINHRLLRALFSVNKIYNRALELNADIYHLHDPELIRIGLKLVKKGKKVIFDSHELVGDQILSKFYIPKYLRNIFSRVYHFYEQNSLPKFSGLIAATPYIRDHLKKINDNTIDICNYPILNNQIIQNSNEVKTLNDNHSICYLGGITKTRGIKELVQALELTRNKVVLHLAGNFTPSSFEQELKALSGWKHVNYLGYLTRNQVLKIYSESLIGIATLYPTPAYINSLPVKIFEYMSCKLPVIASNFKLFCDIFDDVKCGINVDPCNPKEIAKAIDYLIDNATERYEMGKRGYQAVINKYNWNIEEQKLFSFYQKILSH
jgi:glycosyltransferase involved in cell wall biosynthesis